MELLFTYFKTIDRSPRYIFINLERGKLLSEEEDYIVACALVDRITHPTEHSMSWVWELLALCEVIFHNELYFILIFIMFP